MTFATLAHGSLLLLSGFGFLAGAQLSVNHLRHGEICPMIGPVPACIIVFFGYLMVFIALPKVTFALRAQLEFRNVSSHLLWPLYAGLFLRELLGTLT